jgi:hypothetical protein
MSRLHLPRALRWLPAAAALFALAASGGEAPRPVVVELFTSQGCSSCPPADRLLTEIGEAGVDGVEVIPLSFHVDYWNYIGWTDPFSAATWSQRQRLYAARLAGDRVYTPQLVVDGRSEAVGSDRREVRRLVAEAARRQERAAIALATASSGIALEASLDAASPETADVLLAVFETGLTTEVASGENARRTLRNDYVVRRLIPVGQLEPGATIHLEVPLDLDASWRRDHLGVAVFAQGSQSLEILGAGVLRL